MTTKPVAPARCAVIVGPYTAGKTTLLEALLFAAGAVPRKGSIAEGSTLGDASPEARARQMSVEPNFAHCRYLEEQWFLIDCPGSIELTQDARLSLMAADIAVVVAEPDPAKAANLAPLLRFLDSYQIPHVVFINKMDRAAAPIRELLEAMQVHSAKPLVLRQVPIRDSERVSGFVDLVSERAYRYQKGKPSDLIEMPETVKAREGEARQELLESLADFDDALLEQLLEEKVPAKDEVYRQIAKDLENDLIVPVLLGSALDDNGITRLWKTLRHDGPTAEATARRLGIPEEGALAATVVKTLHQSHTGKLSIARLWRGTIEDGQSFDGDRLSGLFHLHGANPQKATQAKAGELVALGRMENLKTGQLLGANGPVEGAELLWPETPKPVYALALTPQNRQDEVKLTASLAKLIEEDGSLALEHNADTHQMLLWGQGEIQLQLAVERLKSKYNVAVETGRPMTAYKETIRRSIKQHSRFKRQSGGHGQFADVQIEIKPLQRGRGFEFVNNIVGGAIPKNYIPAVDHGCQEYLSRGPLGFPVVDIQVTLFDGQFHSVDSSDQAFKTAGRMALSEGMPQCDPVLLEPIFEVVISVPNEYTAKIHGLVSARRGQILGFEAREGWAGWDQLKCYLPQSEVQDLIVELRSLTSGLGTFEWRFDHLQELTGRLADKVIEARQSTAAE